jgi:hypothetical protein
MAFDPNQITDKTFIDVGFPLTQNFLLEHMTSGAILPMNGNIFPLLQRNIFSQRYANSPLWQITRNLSSTGLSILEPLLAEFGSALQLNSAFNNIAGTVADARHLFGSALDISIKGAENDLSYLATDIAKIARKASSLTLNYGVTSWMHIDVSQAKLGSNWSATSVDLPSITTNDLVNGITEQGVYSMRSTGSNGIDLSLANALYDDAGNVVDVAGNILVKAVDSALNFLG